MAFQLSDTVNKDKVFLVKRSELEGRLDTVFYKPVYRENEKKIRENTYAFDSVSHIANRIADGPFGSDLKAEEYQPDGIPLLRVSNLKTGEIEGDIVFISEEKHNQLKRSTVYPNDVVLTKAGAILGYSAVFPKKLGEGNITSHLVTITCRDDVNPQYLSCFFRSSVGQLQIYRWGNKSTRPELNTGEVEKILVPLPPAEIQNQIVAKMNAAYTAKKQKEAQAQQLLDSIDSYLLHELGIELPVEEENGITQRMFVRKFSEVSGGRFDAPGNWNRLNLYSAIYDNVLFNTVVAINPMTSLGFEDDTTVATFLPMESVSDVYGEASLTQTRQIGESKGYTLFQDNDLIWAKITPCMENGKSAVVQNLVNGIGFGSTEYHVFRSQETVNIHYIHALLRLKRLRMNAVNFFSGSAGHQRVDELFFRKMTIPLPPLKKQNEIAAQIQTIRDRAKQLRAEAAAGLEQAKSEVEAMILGKDSNQ